MSPRNDKIPKGRAGSLSPGLSCQAWTQWVCSGQKLGLCCPQQPPWQGKLPPGGCPTPVTLDPQPIQLWASVSYGCRQGTRTAYSRAFTRASLASIRIWISALATSSAAPDSSDCAFSKFALAACSGWVVGEGQAGTPAWPPAPPP